MNDGLVPAGEAKVHVLDRGLVFSESIYEVMPVTGGRVQLLDEHTERMLRGAELLGIDAGLPDSARWRLIVESLIEAERIVEGLVYAQLTGGTAPRAHVAADDAQPTFFA